MVHVCAPRVNLGILGLIHARASNKELLIVQLELKSITDSMIVHRLYSVKRPAPISFPTGDIVAETDYPSR